MSRNNYNLLSQAFSRHHQLKEVASLLQWDQMAKMNSSPSATAQRARAVSAVQDQMHAVLSTQDVLKNVTHLYVDQEELTIEERANFREMVTFMKIRKSSIDYNQERKLKMAKQIAASEAFSAWHKCVPSRNWEAYVPALEKIVGACRDYASFSLEISEDPTLNHGYDTLLETHERELRTVFLDSYYTGLKEWLPSLIERTRAQVASEEPPIYPEAHYRGGEPVSKDVYEAFAKDVLTLLDFDFARGRIDAADVNVTSASSEHTRILFHAEPTNIMSTVNHIFHEAGHAKYEQGRPKGHFATQPAGWARSTAWHESQSQFFELFILRHPAFADKLSDLMRKHFGSSNPALTPENLKKLYRRPHSLIPRKNEPNVTTDLSMQIGYMIWYELERDLFLKKMSVSELPDAITEKFKKYAGIDLTSIEGGRASNLILGQQQWAQGNFGYIPVYTPGLLYAAQLWASMCNDLGGESKVDAMIGRAEFAEIFDWLERVIWKHGSILVTDDLLVGASGIRLNTRYYQDMMLERYAITPPSA